MLFRSGCQVHRHHGGPQAGLLTWPMAPRRLVEGQALGPSPGFWPAETGLSAARHAGPRSPAPRPHQGRQPSDGPAPPRTPAQAADRHRRVPRPRAGPLRCRHAGRAPMRGWRARLWPWRAATQAPGAQEGGRRRAKAPWHPGVACRGAQRRTDDQPIRQARRSVMMEGYSEVSQAKALEATDAID